MLYADVRKGDWGYLWFSGKHMMRGRVLNPNKPGTDEPNIFYLSIAVNKNSVGSSFWKHRLFGIVRDGMFHYINNEINGKEYYKL